AVIPSLLGARAIAVAGLVLPHYTGLVHGGLVGLAFLLFLLRHAGLRQADRLETDFPAEHIELVLFHFTPAAYRQLRPEEYRSEAHPLEAVDPHALGFPQPTNFAVTALHQADVEPAVDAFATGADHIGELGRAIVQHDAGLQALDHLFIDFAHDPHGIFAVHLRRRVHQAVGQLTIGGEQQQAGGVDVQPADVDPAALFQPRQLFEYGGAAFGVIAGTDFALGLVVDQHAADDFGIEVTLEWTTVDHDLVQAVDPAAQLGRLAVDGDAASADPAFDLTA